MDWTEPQASLQVGLHQRGDEPMTAYAQVFESGGRTVGSVTLGDQVANTVVTVFGDPDDLQLTLRDALDRLTEQTERHRIRRQLTALDGNGQVAS